MLAENFLCLQHGIQKSCASCSNVLFRPVIRVGELSDLVHQSYTKPTESNNSLCVTSAWNVFAVWFQPSLISRRPSILMSKDTPLSLAPPHREIQYPAAVLSSRSRTEPPFASAVSHSSSTMNHAVTTMPNHSNRFIVILQVSRPSAFLFSSVVSSFRKLYLYNTFLSTEKLPTASTLASDR